MKAWLRSRRGIRWLALAGPIVALAVAVVRGQTLPRAMTECSQPPSWTALGFSSDEPPMVDAPKSPRSPPLPSTPFMPPSPRPLPPEQTAPFVPQLPYPTALPSGPPEPIVRLRIQAPGRTEPGKEIEYRLTVENISRAEAHHVVVRDRLPSGVTEAVRAEPPVKKTEPKGDLVDLLWDIGTLQAGASKTIVLVIKPAGNEDVENRAYVQFEHGQQVTTRIAKPGVQVKATVPTQAILYQSIPIRIEVANTGAVPLRSVVVTDELPDGLVFVDGRPAPKPDKPLTWKLGDLPPQQTRRIEYQAISTHNGLFRNKAKVTADGGASASHSAAVSIVEPKLKISISGPKRRLVKRPIPYHLTIRNLGSVTLTNVQVADELPPGTEVISIDIGGRREGGFVRWSLGTLPPGDRRSLHLVLRAVKTGWYWNEATVRADNNLSDKGRFGATYIEAASAPVIEIDRETGSLLVGQKATYTIRLFNPGTSNVLHPGVDVTIPDEMDIKGKRGPTTAQQQGQVIHFDRLDAIEGGKEALYFVDVEAKKAGKATLRASWTDGRQGTGPPESWEDYTIILNPMGAANAPAPASLQVKGKEPPQVQDSMTAPSRARRAAE